MGKEKSKAGAKFPVSDRELKFPHAFLLAASAGSGKTYNLSNRYIQFLLSDKIRRNELSNILAITFTQNATKEMKGRIIKFLKEIYNDKAKRAEIGAILSLPEAELKKKADAALNLIFKNYPDFNVGTIDSFILKILSVSADELGVSPDYEIVFNNNELIETVLTRFFASFEPEAGEKMADDFLEALNNSGGDSYLFNPLPKIRENFSEFMEKENKYLLDIKPVEADLEKHSSLKKKIIGKMRELAQDHAALRPFYLAGVEEVLKGKDYAGLIGLYNPRAGFYNSTKKEVKQALENDGQFSGKIEDINSILQEYYETESVIFYRAFAALYLKFKETFYRLRRRDKVLSLSQITADISRHIQNSSAPEVYIKLAARLNHFLIDEFQDTSLAQWDILRPLVEDSLSRNGSLFLIGDIKQAIYMFRNADYKIMGEFLPGPGSRHLNLDSLEKGVQNFSLASNYRSDGGIIAYVNAFFSAPEFRKYIGENAGGDVTGLLDSAQNVCEGRENLGYVRTIVIKGKQRFWDGTGEELKSEFLKAARDTVSRFPPESVAVLVKKNDEVEKIVGWLSEAGIQAASFSSLDIRKRRVIAEIRALLAFLENPSDNFSFGVFISGVLFGEAAGKDKAARIPGFIFKTGSGEKFLYAAFREKFPELWERFFEELFSKSGYLTVYELINILLAKFSVYEKFPDETAFLVKFSDIAYSLNVSEASAGISALLQTLEEGKDNDEKFSVRLPEFIPAVRVMTFHKAKGLGFGAVINIFDQDAWKSPGGERIYYCDCEGGLALRKISDKMSAFSPALADIKSSEKRDEEIQNLNTLYVAMTRAGHELVNIVKIPERGKKVFSLFKDFEAGKKEKFYGGTGKEPSYLEIKPAAGEKIYDFIRNGERDNFETLRGNVYHMALAGVEYAETADEGVITGLVEKACDFYGAAFQENVKKEAVEKIKKALSNPALGPYFGKKEGRSVRTEAEFISEKGAVCRVDRLIEDKDGICVIDYKTGAEADYSGQMKFYIKTVSEALGKPCRALVYYLDKGEIEVISNQ